MLICIAILKSTQYIYTKCQYRHNISILYACSLKNVYESTVLKFMIIDNVYLLFLFYPTYRY